VDSGFSSVKRRSPRNEATLITLFSLLFSRSGIKAIVKKTRPRTLTLNYDSNSADGHICSGCAANQLCHEYIIQLTIT
jgi:hypothetical protein